MKNIIVLTGIIMAVLFVSACKKCEMCSQICYRCDYMGKGVTVDTLCSEFFGSLNTLNTVIQDQESGGFVCTKLQPAQSYQYCDVDKNFINALQNSGFICQ